LSRKESLTAAFQIGFVPASVLAQLHASESLVCMRFVVLRAFWPLAPVGYLAYPVST